VPDVEYTPHENTVLHLGKRNHKWMKLRKVIRDGEAGMRSARWHKVTFTHFHFGKGLGKEIFADQQIPKFYSIWRKDRIMNLVSEGKNI